MFLIFVILVIMGFLFHFLSTWPVHPLCLRIAWGCWLIASILWVVMGHPQGLSLHGG
jgi:hypothetical protein